MIPYGMSQIMNYFAEHSWARWAAVVMFLLVIARKPTLRYFQWRMEKKASEMEMSSYEILRKEIGTLNRLLLDEQKEKRVLYEKIESLEELIRELRNTIHGITERK